MSAIRNQLLALPKIELHRHLEGAIRLQTLVDIAREHDIDLPDHTVEGLRVHVQISKASPHTTAHFLGKFAVLRRFFISRDVIQRITREAVIDAARDNVRYMELRFTPRALAKLMNYPYDQVIEWVCDAVAEEQKRHNIQVRLIIAVNRHESLRDAALQIEGAISHKRNGVVGVDLCGQEVGYPAEPFAPLFQDAKQMGLGVTIHAGEWDSARNIAIAIELLGASRIGHGVRILEDSGVAQLARTMGTTFEVCPTSNVHTGSFPNYERHPLHEMTVLGLRTTINTDDPGISNITLSDEYHTAHEKLDFFLKDIHGFVRRAAEAVMLPPAERQTLLNAIAPAMTEVPIAPDR